ncbi:T9SS type A sorting domain-containing protein [Candidatus Sulfidibacterium hydrothermale]|uniref:T9SS type A sorting domain-containing protein n=1 Tax=Candidatus Sulfidibacterium hydrothermale TaxID=2875962 RepID=UPI001F0A31D9|nr:T9SS type A sorting domain-containing protein [Candidatus Sulfidibacterium hydrothermale]UBM62228.1 T9SS type A sorting domain-containing protein [Candidatus Sulfidibacterium hydrothermale]
MKTFTRILFILLASIAFVFSAFGQNKSFDASLNPEQAKNPSFLLWDFPVNFHERLHPAFPYHDKHNKSLNVQDITLDTVSVTSYFENPKRYIYTYSSGNLTMTLVQEEGNNGWENNTVNICVYDTSGNKLVSIWENWQDSVWVNAAKNIYTYGFNNVMETCVGEIWNNGEWEKSDSTTYTYDASGKLLSSYKEVWNDSTWVDNTFDLATYDSVGNLVNLTSTVWDDSLGWLKKQQYFYTYDTNHNVLTALIQNGVNFQWQNFYKEEYTYDSANNKLSYIGQTWRETDSTWVNSEQYLYTYDTYGWLTNALGQNWDTVNNQWVNYVNAQYTHDLYGGIESDYVQRWNDSVWADSALTQYVYDKYGDAISGDYYTWDGNSWVINQDGPFQVSYNYNIDYKYFVGYHFDAAYSTPVAEAVKMLKSPVSKFVCIPNPASTSSVIQLNLDEKTNVNLSIFDITGKKLKTIYKGSLPKGTYHYPLSLEAFPSGIYFASVGTAYSIKTIKIVWMN